jgi:hypothetical protein
VQTANLANHCSGVRTQRSVVNPLSRS